MTHKYLTSSSLLVLTLALTTPLSATSLISAEPFGNTTQTVPVAVMPAAADIVPVAAPVALNVDAVPAAPVAIDAPAPDEATQAAPAVIPPQAEAVPAAPKASSIWNLFSFGSSSSSSTTAPKEDVKATIAEAAKALRAQHEDSVDDKFEEAGGADLLTQSFIREPKFEEQVKALMAAKDQEETLKAVEDLKEKALGHKATKEEKRLAALEIKEMAQVKATQQGWSFFGWLFGTSKKIEAAPVAAADTKADVVEMASVAPAAEAAPGAEIITTAASAEAVVPTVEEAPAPVAETPNFPEVPADAPVQQGAESASDTTATAAPAAEAPVVVESSTAPAPAVETAVAAAPAVAAKAKQTWFEYFFGSPKKGDALAEVAANLKDKSDNAAVEMATPASVTGTTTIAATTEAPAPSMTASLLKARSDMKAGVLSQEAYETLRSSLVKEAVNKKTADAAPMLIDGRTALEVPSASMAAETVADTTPAVTPTADAVAITINDVAETSKPTTLVDIEDLANDVASEAKTEQHASDYLAFGALFAEVADPSSVDDINAALREAAGEAEAGQVNEVKPVVTTPLTFAEVAKMMPPLPEKPKRPMFTVSSNLLTGMPVPQALPKEDGTYNNVSSVSDDNDDDDSELNGAASMANSLVAPQEDVAATVYGYDMSKAEHEAYVIFSSDRLSANAKKQINKTIRENIAGGVHVSAWPQPNRFYYLQHPNKESFGSLAKGVSLPVAAQVKLKHS